MPACVCIPQSKPSARVPANKDDGLNRKEIVKTGVCIIFQDGCPRGEMPGQVSDRADRLIARLGRMDGNVARFSHGQFGCVLAARWIGLPLIDGPISCRARRRSAFSATTSDHPKVPIMPYGTGANLSRKYLPKDHHRIAHTCTQLFGAMPRYTAKCGKRLVAGDR